MPSENESTNADQINTGGAPAVGNDVNTSGGDFVTRDKHIHGDEVHGDKVEGDKYEIIYPEEQAYTVHSLTNPYLGLRAFSYKDRGIYAGREQLAQETVQRLTAPNAQQTILFITGASGSGKSSFAQAALIPLLETHYAAYQKTARYAIFRPSSQPMAMLRDALQKLHPDLTPETLAANTPKEQINLLLIDQFEELFIQSDASQRAPFCDFLTNLPGFEACRTHILITLRVDYLDELFAIQSLWAIAKEGVELRTMRADDLRNAIQKPLQVTHPTKRFAPALLECLVQDAGQDAALLPLLQVTLAELWKTGKLVLSNYHSLTDAIRQRAETVYAFRDHANADPKAHRAVDEQQELMGILLDLINVSVDGVDRRDVRQRRARQELEQGSPQRPHLIEELVNGRLLAAATETRNGADVEVIDIIHESLIDNWARLRDAIDEQRQQLQRRARFKLWLGEWLRNERQDGYLLLTDMQLAEARVLVEGRDIEVQGIDAQDFYRRSLARRAAVQRRTMYLGIVGITVLFIAIAMSILFSVGRQAQQRISLAATGEAQARQKAERLNEVIRVDQLSSNGLKIYDTYPQRGLLLAVAAVQTHLAVDEPISISAEENLRTLLARNNNSISLVGSTGIINSVAFSPNGQFVASGSDDGIVKVWESNNWYKQPSVLTGHKRNVSSVRFSPDGKLLASSSYDSTIRVWRINDWNIDPQVLTVPDGKAVVSIAFSPDNSLLVGVSTCFRAACSDDKIEILIWQVSDLQAPPRVYTETEVEITAITFSPNSKLLVFGDEYGEIMVCSINKGDRSCSDGLKLEQEGAVTSLAFSPNGELLVSASTNRIVHVWQVGQWNLEPLILARHYDEITAVTFSSDSKLLATSSRDKTIQIWAVNDWTREPVILRGHDEAVNAIAFSPDSKLLVSASDDKMIRIWTVARWSTEPITLLGHKGWVHLLSFSPDGQLLASGGEDRTIRVWQINNPQIAPHILMGDNSDIQSLAFSLNNKFLVGAYWDNLYIWRVNKWELVPIIVLHASKYAFSPDSKLLATSGATGDNYTVQIWRVDDWQIPPIQIAQYHFENSATALTFSPDGKFLISGNNDHKIWVWQVGNWGGEPRLLIGHDDVVSYVGFTPDNKSLVSLSQDNLSSLRMSFWNVSDWKETYWTSIELAKESTSAFSLSPNRNLLASGYGKILRINLLNDLQVEPQILIGHQSRIGVVAFSPDGRVLGSGSDDKSIRLWQLDHLQRGSLELLGHQNIIASLAFSPDDKLLASGDWEGTIKLWDVKIQTLVDLACRVAGRNLTWDEWQLYFPGTPYARTCDNWPIHPSVVAEAATATAQAMPSPTVIPKLTATLTSSSP